MRFIYARKVVATLEEVVENVVNEIELLQSIHTDLGVVTSFLVFFTLVIVCYFIYKFFDMMWKF